MARIVLNPFGSLGDLHPFMALGIELRARGHEVTMATCEVYRRKVKAEGLEFAPVRPDAGELAERPDFLGKLWDARNGGEFLLRDLLMPAVEASFEDVKQAARHADLVITHGAAFGGPPAAELLRKPWLSIALQPSVFLSEYDQPVFAAAPGLQHLRFLGRYPFRLVMAIADTRIKLWAKPLLELRNRVGLPPLSKHPLVTGQLSPFGTIALFSPQLASPQADWPTNVRVAGFAFYDRLGELPNGPVSDQDASGLATFLQAGSPPVLFTLGSSAVMDPGAFYAESIEAIRRVGCRAILLAGPSADDLRRQFSSSSVYVASYAPYSTVMPKVSVIVHQGGVGTTAQAMRAGRPMLVVPWGFDQPDNAARLKRLGVARLLNRNRYRAARVARQLKLLMKSEYLERAAQVGSVVRQEDGSRCAADMIEQFLTAATRSFTGEPQPGN